MSAPGPNSYFTSAAHFIAERSDWFDVSVRQNGDDGLYDVVLRIDGSYLDRADAEEMAEHFTEELRALANRARAASSSHPQST
jgi:hypothetical protein